jgi:hypothetical protein
MSGQSCAARVRAYLKEQHDTDGSDRRFVLEQGRRVVMLITREVGSATIAYYLQMISETVDIDVAQRLHCRMW